MKKNYDFQSMINRVKEVKKEMNLTNEQLSELAGVPLGTLNKIFGTETKEPQIGTIIKISTALNISTDYIIFGDDVPKNSIPLSGQAYMIPLYDRISATYPATINESIIGQHALPIELNDGGNYFAMRVYGDSMNLTPIPDGSTIIVKKQNHINNNEIAVVIVNGDDATVKKVRKEGDMFILMPNSTNSEHQPHIIDLKKTDVRICGKVVKVEYNI